MSDYSGFSNIYNANEYTYTIFSKSGCVNCVKAKKMIQDRQTECKNYNVNVEIIDCDEYLLEDRTGFLNYIEALVGKKVTLFPIIFIGNSFIGSLNELILLFSKKDAFDTVIDF
jgi:glutaredoxin